MIIGHVENSSVSSHTHFDLYCSLGIPSKVQLPIPVIPSYAPAPVINPQLVFRALRVIQASDLDLNLWNLAIEEKETSYI